MNYMIMPIFDKAHPKVIETTFCFPEFAPPCKKSFFDQHLIYVNLHQHAKNQATSLICSGDMVD